MPTTSPTRPAAAAPASMAALTAATSPTTRAVTMPLPIFCQPISVTLADFSIASLASISGTRPLVSIMPRASMWLLAMSTPVGEGWISERRGLPPPCRPPGGPGGSADTSLEQLEPGGARQVAGVALVGVQVDLQLRSRRQPAQQPFQHCRAVAA